MSAAMSPVVKAAVPVIPAMDAAESLAWWVGVCGFEESFRDTTPPAYVWITRGGASLHLAQITDAKVARAVGEQTMVRLVVEDVEAMYAEYQERGGTVHPNGALQMKPWGSREFGAIDPNGVCVTFQG